MLVNEAYWTVCSQTCANAANQFYQESRVSEMTSSHLKKNRWLESGRSAGQYNGEEVERDLYEDQDKIATVTVTRDRIGVLVKGLVGPKHRIEPMPFRERSEDGIVPHAIHEIEFDEMMDKTANLRFRAATSPRITLLVTGVEKSPEFYSGPVSFKHPKTKGCVEATTTEDHHSSTCPMRSLVVQQRVHPKEVCPEAGCDKEGEEYHAVTRHIYGHEGTRDYGNATRDP
ncbi:hypothetical protein HPB49_020176 [Dermacentor silvarum]|uniref:Uncharacterized protein n=1 Tax=Dermacentor silvarum TaxID=543639 RepID=A0ACB8C590_DERSI|nr:hypothetical protein HPB49_020176 [Dermacentor silvarum]